MIDIMATLEGADCPPDIPSDVQSRRNFALITTTIILILSIVTYSLRLYCRRKTGQGFRSDDILMGIGLIISMEPSICEYLLLQNGLGRHSCNVPLEQRNQFAVISFALQRANQPALAFIKISILIFYLRIFSRSKAFRWAVYANMAYTTAWAVSTWIVNLTVCTPVAFYYDHTIPGGSCKNQAISGSVNGGLSLFGDVCILVLPLPMVWQLKINTRKKIAVCGIFMLGCFICVASAIRIVALTQFIPTDATYTQVYASTWTDLELGVAVISGNLPLLAPLFDRYFRNKSSIDRYYYDTNGHRLPSTSGGGGGGKSTHRSRQGLGTHSGGGGGTMSGHNRDAKTTITSGLRRGDFDRLSDGAESQTQLTDSVHDAPIEMDDRAILVKTQVEITTSPINNIIDVEKAAGGGGGGGGGGVVSGAHRGTDDEDRLIRHAKATQSWSSVNR